MFHIKRLVKGVCQLSGKKDVEVVVVTSEDGFFSGESTVTIRELTKLLRFKSSQLNDDNPKPRLK